VRGVAGDLLDAEVPVRQSGDLRQVRDRDHLCPSSEATQGLADGVGGLTANACVDLVEDHRLAATDGGGPRVGDGRPRARILALIRRSPARLATDGGQLLYGSLREQIHVFV
jgi:hypothetical protein